MPSSTHRWRKKTPFWIYRSPQEIAARKQSKKMFRYTTPRPSHNSNESSNRKSWKLLDDELDIILEAAMQGPANRKLQTLTTIV